MKKTILTIAAAAAFLFQANAQEVALPAGDIKPTGGDISLEANVGVFNNNVSLSNSLNQIRGRYFLSDDMAIRLGFHVSTNSNDLSRGNFDVEQSEFRFSINPGIEKHFAGTERLSPYVGAELSFAVHSLKEEGVDPRNNNRFETKGTWDSGPRGFTQIGLNAVAGMDFYVARHLFVGYELGLGFYLRNTADIERTTQAPGQNAVTVTTKGDGNFSLGPNVLNGVRVGFTF